ncbi:hypothetical protein [uncultured Desulfosarcina sp.]|uniref:hypothetical protein n=1 Tax=uncultured Desulfosarcina sp. TaxID=218289 RepID=UPI0029C8CED6|nr:hypothetical protein [uncultured Desulfosarcina sp.]
MTLRKILRLTTISILFFFNCILFTLPQSFAAETDNKSRCNRITLEKAAIILGVSTDDLQKSNIDIMVSPDDIKKKTFKIKPCTCAIRSKSNFLKGINYIIYVYNDPGQARIDFNKMQNNYETISTADIVPGIGDETFWVSDTRFQRMVSIKGNILVDVLSPKEFDLQKQIISLVLSNL